jgi:hypothetical protein
MSTVLKYGHSWTYEGLSNFFMDPAVAEKVNNTSCQSILSSFKFFYLLQYGGQSLPTEQEEDLRLTLRGRRNLVPDMPRIVGAINAECLEKLHGLYKVKLDRGALSALEYQELLDASTMMRSSNLPTSSSREGFNLFSSEQHRSVGHRRRKVHETTPR